jgi:hypothetical protein
MHWCAYERFSTQHDAFVGVSLAGMTGKLELLRSQLEDNEGAATLLRQICFAIGGRQLLKRSTCATWQRSGALSTDSAGAPNALRLRVYDLLDAKHPGTVPARTFLSCGFRLQPALLQAHAGAPTPSPHLGRSSKPCPDAYPRQHISPSQLDADAVMAGDQSQQLRHQHVARPLPKAVEQSDSDPKTHLRTGFRRTLRRKHLRLLAKSDHMFVDWFDVNVTSEYNHRKHDLLFAREMEMRAPWRHVDYHQMYGSDLPRAPGVYAVLRVKRTSGIPVSLNVLYVGKSRNLHKRFSQHTDPYRQHNKILNALLDKPELEFWYVPVEVADLDTVERRLIRELAPSANVVRYVHAAP